MNRNLMKRNPGLVHAGLAGELSSHEFLCDSVYPLIWALSLTCGTSIWAPRINSQEFYSMKRADERSVPWLRAANNISHGKAARPEGTNNLSSIRFTNKRLINKWNVEVNNRQIIIGWKDGRLLHTFHQVFFSLILEEVNLGQGIHLLVLAGNLQQEEKKEDNMFLFKSRAVIVIFLLAREYISRNIQLSRNEKERSWQLLYVSGIGFTVREQLLTLLSCSSRTIDSISWTGRSLLHRSASLTSLLLFL